MGFLLLNRSAHTHKAGTEQVHRAAQVQLCLDASRGICSWCPRATSPH